MPSSSAATADLFCRNGLPMELLEMRHFPTCASTASQQEIESLVRLMIQRHFVELPQKGFPSYVGAAEGFPLHLHTIVVSTKTKHGVWVFETGELNGKRESIPPDFVAVEDNLRQLKSAMTGTPCPNAPEIKLQF